MGHIPSAIQACTLIKTPDCTVNPNRGTGTRLHQKSYLARRSYGSAFALFIVLWWITPTCCHHFISNTRGGRSPLETTLRWGGWSQKQEKKEKIKRKRKKILIHAVLLLHVHQRLKSKQKMHTLVKYMQYKRGKKHTVPAGPRAKYNRLVLRM